MNLVVEVNKPTVAASYLQLLVEIIGERGFTTDQLFRGLPVSQSLLDHADSRMSPVQWALAVNRAMNLTGDQGLGYECGLRMRPTVNGYLGYAAMSCATLGDALNLLARYFTSRQRGFSLSLVHDGPVAMLELKPNHAIPTLRRFFHEHILIGVVSGAAATLGEAVAAEVIDGVEVCFDWPEPAYHDRYACRLPSIRFDAPSSCVRFPVEILRLKPVFADPQTSRMAVEHCERELLQVGGERGTMRARVEAELLLKPHEGYPDQEAVAQKLGVSTRTLARQLKIGGTNFRVMLDEARRRDACKLMESSPLNLAEIASQLGYKNPANFTRAFQKWTGETPSAYRARHKLMG